MSNTTNKIRWGIIGPGKVAHKFATDIRKVPNAGLFAVASRNMDKARSFASQYHIATYYDSYQRLAGDPDVDAVYIASPHIFHREHSILCLKRKKAVLCEKPFAMNSKQVKEMIESAKANDTLLMEAMWTIFLPHFQMVMKEIKEGAIGNVTGIEADFGFSVRYDPESRLFKKELGGGSLLDIGIYPVFLALSVLGMPDKIEANATFFDNGADSSCNMVFNYGTHAKALLHCTLLKQTPTAAIIRGDSGKIIIHPKFHQPAAYTIEKDGKTRRFDIAVSTLGFNYEIEHFSNLLLNGKTESNIMTFSTSEQLIHLLDAVRDAIGLHY